MGNCSTEQDAVGHPAQQLPSVTPLVHSKLDSCIFKFTENHIPLKEFGKGIRALIYKRMTEGTIMQEYSNEVMQIREKKCRFIDIEFKAEKKSIGQRLHLNNVNWKKAQDFGKETPIFFSAELDTLDLKQGKIQNYYFSSAIAAISHSQNLLNSIISLNFNHQLDYSEQGFHQVWLCVDGGWKNIIIDDQLPSSFGDYPFTRYLNQVWVMLLEKAYAKYFKSFQNIEAGLCGPFLTALTGAPSTYLCQNSHKQLDPQKVWAQIKEAIMQNHIIAISTECNDPNEHFDKDPTFSYPVIDCQEVYIMTSVKKKRERILKLDNCWGRYEWKGRWSEYSDVWSEQLRLQLGYEKADDSIMWINIEDMIQNFGQICICKYNPEYVTTTQELVYNQFQNEVKGVFIHVTEPTEGLLSLVQKDFRHYFKNYKYSTCRMILLSLKEDTGQAQELLAQTSTTDYYSTLEVTLNPGLYYLLVEMDWKCSFTKITNLNFYGDKGMKFTIDPNMPSIDSIFYQLCKLDEESQNKVQIHIYPEDCRIKRVRGQFAGYIYLHYSNNSEHNKLLSEKVSLDHCKNVQTCNEEKKNQFTVKLMPGEERLVKMKAKGVRENDYTFAPVYDHRMMEKYSEENLLQMLRKKPTSLKRREIDGSKVDVFVRMFEYSGGVALLYENCMNKYSFIEEIKFQSLINNSEFNLELQPDTEKLLFFSVIDPSMDYIFKTKVSYFLSNPQFTF